MKINREKTRNAVVQTATAWASLGTGRQRLWPRDEPHIKLLLSSSV